MGSFFTNVQLRVPDGVAPRELAQRAQQAALAVLEGEGFWPAAAGDPLDRELVILAGERWVSFYDMRAEDQDATNERWARALSQTLTTTAVSVLVHDSDVLALGLYVEGEARDRFDSNPEFSGTRPSRLTPAARAKRWASVVQPGHDVAGLEAVFCARPTFAEQALAPLASAMGVEPDRLGTGYRYLVEDDEVPEDAIRVPLCRATRPAWERRTEGPARFASVWPQDGERPEIEPQQGLVGESLQLHATVANRGGPARGLAIELSGGDGLLHIAGLELVIRRGGDFERHAATLVADGPISRAVFPEVVLPPGAAVDASSLVGAPVAAFIEVHHAGQIHVNLYGDAVAAGETRVSLRLVPLDAPEGAHTEALDVELRSLECAPLRARGGLRPHELDPLVGDDHTYLSLLVGEPRERVAAIAGELLTALEPVWPGGRWSVYSSDDPRQRGRTSSARGALADARVARLLRTKLGEPVERVGASMTGGADSSHESFDRSGFEVRFDRELGAIALWLAADHVDHATAERLLVPVLDGIARGGSMVQALLVRWSITTGSVDTPYEACVGIDGPHNCDRAWASRWLRAVGPGQLWLGASLAARVTLGDAAAAVGSALRVAVEDVAAVEAMLASLLPSAQDFRAYLDARGR